MSIKLSQIIESVYRETYGLDEAVSPDSGWWYHGSPHKITSFDMAKVAQTEKDMTNGPGLYLTRSLKDAQKYAYPNGWIYRVKVKGGKRFAKLSGSVREVWLSTQLKKAPDYEMALTNWDENPAVAHRKLLDGVMATEEGEAGQLENLWFEVYKGDEVAFFDAVKRSFAGRRVDPAEFGGIEHLVVWDLDAVSVDAATQYRGDDTTFESIDAVSEARREEDDILGEYLVNPTPAEIVAFTKRCAPNYDSRGVFDGTDVYLWNAWKAVHIDAMQRLGVAFKWKMYSFSVSDDSREITLGDNFRPGPHKNKFYQILRKLADHAAYTAPFLDESIDKASNAQPLNEERAYTYTSRYNWKKLKNAPLKTIRAFTRPDGFMVAETSKGWRMYRLNGNRAKPVTTMHESGDWPKQLAFRFADDYIKFDLNEKAPPGWSGTVAHMKRKHSHLTNPYALVWAMYKKGYKPRKKPTRKGDRYLKPETYNRRNKIGRPRSVTESTTTPLHVFRYTIGRPDGRGLMHRQAFDVDRIADDDEAQELVELLSYGLEQPSGVPNGSVFVFTAEGETKNRRLIDLLTKAAKGRVVRTEITAHTEPVWVSGDGQLAYAEKPVKVGGGWHIGLQVQESTESSAQAMLDELRSKLPANPINPRELYTNDGAIEVVKSFGTPNAISLQSIRSFTPKSGGGTRLLKLVTDAADKHGVTLDVDAVPFGKKTMTTTQLVKWYTKHGFKKGKYGEMVRTPRNVQESTTDVVSIEERYGGAKKDRGIWYHGTSYRNLQSILSQGLIPNPKKRAWQEDPDANSRNASRQSLDGIYLTQNLITATSSASRGAYRAGGSRQPELVVAVSLNQRTAQPDEDSLRTYMGLGDHFVDFFALGAYADMRLNTSAYKAKRAEYADRVCAGLERTLGATLHPNQKAAVVAKLGEHYDAELERIASHAPVELRPRDADKNTAWLSRFRDKVRVGGSGEYDYEELVKYRPDTADYWLDPRLTPKPPTKAEKDATLAVDAVMRAVARLDVKRQTVSRGFNPTLRATDPIRYNGSNKIVAVFSIHENPKYKSMDGDEPYKTIKTHYGTIPDDAKKQMEQRLSDKLLYESLDEAAKGKELYHSTGYATASEILYGLRLKAKNGEGFVSFSEGDTLHDISAPKQATLVFDAAKLRSELIKVEYDEDWYDKNTPQASYIAGEGWREQFQLPDYEDMPNFDPDDPDWEPDPENEEALYREAEVQAFTDKASERKWVSKSGVVEIPKSAILRILVRDPNRIAALKKQHPDYTFAAMR